ncbi:hypothetical protein BH10BAC5_BH10BAC5_17200 [soil metagenome]
MPRGWKLHSNLTEELRMEMNKGNLKLSDFPKGTFTKETADKSGKKSYKKLDNSKVERICHALTALKIKFTTEYKFSNERKFKFDIAVLPIGKKVAIEFEGGIYTAGGHTRGSHYNSDCDKYNLAIMEGWKVLRFTLVHLAKKNGEYGIADMVKKLINKK